MEYIVRSEEPDDAHSIHDVHMMAFGREAESTLVEELRDQGHNRVSLLAVIGPVTIGHILLSQISIESDSGSVPALALAPMAVLPECQSNGVGTRLMEAALDQCRADGHKIVVVLGHPDYYPRFGFSAKLAEQFDGPFSGEEFMALELTPGALDGVRGKVVYSAPFGSVE